MPDIAKAINETSTEELAKLVAGFDEETRKKLAAAVAGVSTEAIPAGVVVAGMKGFEDFYNADETAKSAGGYANACDVDVNDGAVFTGKTPDEVAGFLGKLRNDLGGTNIKFTVTKVEGNVHEDVWVADNGAGSCLATWEKVDGDWKIVKDKIKFTPKATGDNAGGVPTEVVASTMKAFEDSYNADETGKSAEAYAAECDVTVNEGKVFSGKTPEEVAGFLGQLRNGLKGTNIKFAVTKVEGKVHDDVWVADNGAGSCRATWEEIDGKWKIVKDEISFTPKVGSA